MIPHTAAFFTRANLPQGPEDSGEWLRNFSTGRLVGVGAACVAAPFILAVPALQRDSAAVLVGALLAACLGLAVARRAATPIAACVASALGLVGLMLGAVTGLSPATAGIAAFALLIDWLALPHGPRLSRPAAAMLGAVAAGLLFGALSTPQTGSWQPVLAAILLPLPAVVTLALQMGALRRLVAEQSALARSATRRERVLVDAANAAVIVTDRTGQVLDTTEQALALLATEGDEITGRGLIDRVLISDRPAFLKALADAGLGLQRLEVRLAQNGHYATFRLEVRQIEGGSTGEPALAITLTDRIEAGSLAARKDIAPVLAALGHEVRTPMNAILGFSEMLANPGLCPRDPARVAEYARIIHRQAQNSFAVTTAVIDLVRVEHSAFDAREPIVLAEAMRAAVAHASGQSAGEVALALDCEDADLVVVTDPAGLRILLRSVVDGLAAASAPVPAFRATIARTRFGVEAVLSVGSAATEAGQRRETAFVEVIHILTDALSQRLGLTCRFDQSGGAWCATLRFGAAAETVRLPPREIADNVIPLKKSA